MSRKFKHTEPAELLSVEVREELRLAASRRGVRLLLEQGASPTVAAFAAAVLVVMLGWKDSNHVILGLFLAFIAALSVVRILIIKGYEKAPARSAELDTLHHRYLAVQWLHGIGVGSLYAYSTVSGSLWVALTIAVISVGQASVSMISLGTSLYAFLGLALPILIGPTLGLLSHQVLEATVVAIGIMIAGSMIVVSAKRWRNQAIEATEHALLNKRLAGSLLRARSKAKAYTEELAQESGERAKMQLALTQIRERAHATLESIGDGVVACDADGLIEFINHSAGEMLNLDVDRALKMPLWAVVTLVDSQLQNPVNLQQITMGGEDPKLPVDMSLGRGDLGDALSVTASLSPVSMSELTSQAGGWVLVLHDQTELRELTDALVHQAAHDSLTQLYNRNEFERRLALLLEQAEEARGHVLLFMDLDKFKVINDTNGHAAGDVLLSDISRLMQSFVKPSDTLARLGGDEFSLLLPRTSVQAARVRAAEIVRAVREFRMSWEDQVFSVGISIGIVELDGGVMDVGGALSRADHACYVAKDRGGNRFYVHNEKDEDLVQHQTISRWLTRLQAAMTERRFELWVQPIVALENTGRSDELFGEILLRLRTPNGSIVSPVDFLPSAERYRLMPEIDRLVVQTFVDWLAAGNHPGMPFTGFMVNLSGQSFSDTAFHEYLENCLQTSPELAKWLCFEVTESAVVSNIDIAIDFMKRIGDRGVRFALDDFGSGLSSLNYLKRLPVDFLKIDGTFIRNIADDEIDQLMVQSVATWSRALGIRTIAEYVERPYLLHILREIGIDFVQGYALGKPAPLDESCKASRSEFQKHL